MKRNMLLACGLSLSLALLGCHTLQYTAGVCDCDPPPVISLLAEPKLPAHVCAAPTAAPYDPAPPRVRPDDKSLTPPKAIEGDK